MPFPAKNPKYYFVCPEDENPYPGVKINKDLPNKDIYPYIPSCGKRDQMTPGIKSKYQRYIQGILPTYEQGAKAEKKISTVRFYHLTRFHLFQELWKILLKGTLKSMLIWSDMVSFTHLIHYFIVYVWPSMI